MKSAMPRLERCFPIAVFVLVGTLWLPAASAWEFTFASPEVEAAVEKALDYLEKHASDEPRPGGQVLVGLTFLKARKPDHPAVQAALAATQRQLAQPVIQGDVYTVGLMLVFLCELPPDERQAELIDRLVDQLRRMQKPHGGWGYLHLETGDTSMTQMAVLGLWSADAAGHSTPLECWEKVTHWLMRTQAPNGSFSYQGKDPGGFTSIEQDTNGTRPSMCAAGSGCLYMCADYFGLLDEKRGSGTTTADTDHPLKRVKQPNSGRNERKSSLIDRGMLWERIAMADQYMNAHYTVYPEVHPHYYLYALERYKTFKDYCDGNDDAEAAWYTEAAQNLLNLQKEDGHWASSRHENGDVCDTCFATLFLLRSMRQKIVARLGGGLLAGGRLYELERQERIARGKRHQSLSEIESLLDELAAGRRVDLFDVQLAGDEHDESELRSRLRVLLADAKSPWAKCVVLRKLAELHNLDDVPLLIEALRDPNADVYRAANDALRFLSRKFSGPGFRGEDDIATRKQVVVHWKKWYRSLRREYELAESR